jgi:aryl-alcohol dehydrogenase-like predicted oxidoreductase
MRDVSGQFSGLNGRPEYVKQACEASLKRLGVEHIDLYYQHRMDPDVPIEETVAAMADLVKEGKIGYLGLSEAGPETLKRANAIHPISALQSEYSLWSRDLEQNVLACCEELGIGLVAYSPLGRGFLTGAIKNRADLAEGDWRLNNPRFDHDNFAKNLIIVERIQQIAKDKNCTPAQLALAWISSQNSHFVSIPGTRNINRLRENARAAKIELSAAELQLIADAFPIDVASGTRYPEALARIWVN